MQTRSMKKANQKLNQELRLNLIQYNFAVFDESMTKKSESKLIKKRKKKILNQNMWIIEYGMYLRQNWPEVIKCMKECNADRLDLHDNKHCFIIRDLCRPAFTNIVSLVLQKNQIVSIEALAFIQMDMLNFIDLDDNLITVAKPMNKLKWPLLRKLQMRSNHIQQSNFVRMHNQKEIHKIYLDEAIDSRLICQDLAFLFKMEGTSLFKLQIEGQNRIQEYKKINCLIRRFDKIFVNSWY